MVRLSVAAGLIALLAASASGETSRTIEIDIEHSRFVPDGIVVQAGEKVRFVIRNNDPIDHEFIVGDEEVQRIHEEGTEAHHGAKPGEISVAALDEGSTAYVFGAPDTLIFGCHLPGHYDFGMRGEIRIR